MSANNFILIKWKKPSYIVSHRDVDTGYEFKRLGTAKTLEKAVGIANRFMADNVVEYGLSIIQRPNLGEVGKSWKN